MLSLLLLDRELDGIIYDVGMPVRHNGVLFNSRIVVLDGKILLIRPKMSLGELTVLTAHETHTDFKFSLL